MGAAHERDQHCATSMLGVTMGAAHERNQHCATSMLGNSLTSYYRVRQHLPQRRLVHVRTSRHNRHTDVPPRDCACHTCLRAPFRCLGVHTFAAVALPLRARVLSYYLLPIAYDLLPVDQSEFIWACVQGVIDALKSPQSKRRWPE